MSKIAKSETVKVRMDSSEKQSFEEAASMAGISLSAWTRERLRRAAAKELAEAGRQIPFVQAQRAHAL